MTNPKTKTWRVAIDDALDWTLPTDREATTLRQALIDAAESDLNLEDADADILIQIWGNQFVLEATIYLPKPTLVD